MPRVSVIVPCFNSSATLAETLESVLAQSFGSWEAIVVNDGSTDTSADVIAQYCHRDPRITSVAQGNLGPGGARNTGLAVARGEFVVFLDADDLLLPTMLERMVARIARDASIAVAHCGWIFSDPDARDLSWVVRASAEGALFDHLAHGNLFPCHSLMLRRSLFAVTGDFDASLWHADDWDLWIRVARTGARFGSVPPPLVVYRMRPTSRSRSPRTLFEVGAQVVRRAHEPDPRVRRPAPELENGCHCARARKPSIPGLVYCLGLAVAKGTDAEALELVETVLGANRHELTPRDFRKIAIALHFGAAIPWNQSERLVSEVGATLLRFLLSEESASKRPGFAMASIVEILEALSSHRGPRIDAVSGREMLALLPRRLFRRQGLARRSEPTNKALQ